MSKIKGWNKIEETKEAVRYKSSDGALLEIIHPWHYKGAKKSFVALSINGKTSVIFENRTKTDATKKALEWMNTFPSTNVFVL